jgi:hypothetical protein
MYNIRYKNIIDNKSTILKDNKNKSGVYKYTNIVTNEDYVGSSTNIGKRFSRYFSINYLKSKTERYNSRIYTAILKYGYDNFNIEILEYMSLSSKGDKNALISREQHYIDLLKPRYNICKKAGSLLGFKHSPKTISKLKNRKNKTGHQVILININDNNNIKEFSSIRLAAKYLNISHTTLLRYINSKKLLKDVYFISRK